MPVRLSPEPTVSMVVVRGLLDAVEHAGVPRAELLREGRLSSEPVDAAEARVPRAKVFELCALALRLTGNPALGLHWAENHSDSMFVPISHLIAHAASLRKALEGIAHFYRLLSDEATYELIETEQHVIVRCRPWSHESLEIQRFCSEMMAAGFFRLLRCFAPDVPPLCASFAYAAPSYSAEYARVFHGLERFDQPFSGVIFDRAVLDRPAPFEDRDVHQVLEALAERRLSRITRRAPYAHRVRDVLLKKGITHRNDMETVAGELGLSVRSLRRRLAEEGRPYHALLHEARAIMAKHLLRDKQRTIQETAYEMGFSDATAFHRAFKRWTGMTPSSFRNTQDR